MDQVTIRLRVKPVQRQFQVFNTKTREQSRGPGAVECDCGQYFAAFLKPTKPEYDAFVNALERRSEQAMIEAGHPAPFMGAVNLAVKIVLKRPQYHFNSDGTLGHRSVGARPSGVMDIIKVLETVKGPLSGIVYDNAYSVVSLNGSGKEYGPEDSLEITVTTIPTGDPNQPSLF